MPTKKDAAPAPKPLPRERWLRVVIGEYLDPQLNPGNEGDWADWSQGSFPVKNCNLILEGDGKGPVFRRRQYPPLPRESRCFYRIVPKPRYGPMKGWDAERDYSGYHTKNKAALTGKASGKPFGTVDLYTHLPYIAGLGLNESLPVTVEDSDDESRRHEWVWRQRYAQHDSNKQSAEQESQERQEEEPDSEWEWSVLDVLGTYHMGTRHVTMYVKLIKTVAKFLGVKYQTLYEVVLAHELSHAVTHLAYGQDFKIWESFEHATSESKELLAQLLPFVLFSTCNMPEHAEAMEKLSRYQSNKYNAYKKYAGAAKEGIWDVVEAERQRPVAVRAVAAATSGVSFQIDYDLDSVWKAARTHIFEDGRVLTGYDRGPGMAPLEERPFVEDTFTKIFLDELPGRVSKPTLEHLKIASRRMMRLDREIYGVPEGLVMDGTSQTLGITLDGVTRVFKTESQWGEKQAVFEEFFSLVRKATGEANEKR